MEWTSRTAVLFCDWGRNPTAVELFSAVLGGLQRTSGIHHPDRLKSGSSGETSGDSESAGDRLVVTQLRLVEGISVGAREQRDNHGSLCGCYAAL